MQAELNAGRIFRDRHIVRGAGVHAVMKVAEELTAAGRAAAGFAVKLDVLAARRGVGVIEAVRRASGAGSGGAGGHG